jgi:hypothetical protein
VSDVLQYSSLTLGYSAMYRYGTDVISIRKHTTRQVIATYPVDSNDKVSMSLLKQYVSKEYLKGRTKEVTNL